jgi:hypothetical protein
MSEDERLSKPDSKAGILQRAALKWLRQSEREPDGLPTSIRFIFYVLEHLGLVAKRPTGPWRRGDQDLQDAVTHLRETGIIPWDWIVDEGRALYSWRCAPSVYQHLIDTVDLARIDPWVGLRRPLFLCESKTFGGVLERTLGPDYLCDVAATSGQARGFLITKVAPAILAEGMRVLYVGDADDCGGDIEANSRSVLELEGCDFGDGGWERVALTPEQVLGLKRRGVKPVMKSDKRRPGLRECWEVEALGQSRVVGMLRRRLDGLLPESLAIVLEREEEQRERSRRVLARLG